MINEVDKDGVGVIRGVTSHFVVVIMSYSVQQIDAILRNGD